MSDIAELSGLRRPERQTPGVESIAMVGRLAGVVGSAMSQFSLRLAIDAGRPQPHQGLDRNENSHPMPIHAQPMRAFAFRLAIR